MTFTPTGTVAPNFTMKVGFYRLDSGIFVPIASVTADAGFATGGPQYLQFGAQPVVGQTIQAQLVIAGSAVTTAILIEGGLSSDFPR
jgi:hypothetical protein